MSKSPNEQISVKILNYGFIPEVTRWDYSQASIPAWRFYWNLEPGAWVHSYEEDIALTPDVALLIPPHTPFSTRAERKFAHFYVHFVLSELIPDRKLIMQLPIKDIMSAYTIAHLPEFSSRQLNMAAWAAVNGALLMLPEDALLQERAEPGLEAFNKALQIIENDPGFSCSCEELAKLCQSSVNTLQRQFMKAAGVTVKKWLLNRKMEYAIQLLKYRGCSIKESADLLGFADRYHFSKVFKSYFGITPAQFVRDGGIYLP